jgi:hypothetical protein
VFPDKFFCLPSEHADKVLMEKEQRQPKFKDHYNIVKPYLGHFKKPNGRERKVLNEMTHEIDPQSMSDIDFEKLADKDFDN